jgi:hypothetical protein
VEAQLRKGKAHENESLPNRRGFGPGLSARTAEPDIASIDAYVSAHMQTNHIPVVAFGLVHNDQFVHLRAVTRPTRAGERSQCAPRSFSPR